MAPRSSGSSRQTKPRRTPRRVAKPADPVDAVEEVDDVEMIRAEEFVQELDQDEVRRPRRATAEATEAAPEPDSDEAPVARKPERRTRSRAAAPKEPSPQLDFDAGASDAGDFGAGLEPAAPGVSPSASTGRASREPSARESTRRESATRESASREPAKRESVAREASQDEDEVVSRTAAKSRVADERSNAGHDAADDEGDDDDDDGDSVTEEGSRSEGGSSEPGSGESGTSGTGEAGDDQFPRRRRRRRRRRGRNGEEIRDVPRDTSRDVARPPERTDLRSDSLQGHASPSSGSGGHGGSRGGSNTQQGRGRRGQYPSRGGQQRSGGQGYNQGRGGYNQGDSSGQGYSSNQGYSNQGYGQGQSDLARPDAPSLGIIEGVLELHPKGYGFLRDVKNNYAGVKTDPFVPGSLIEKLRLREGVMIKGEVCSGNRGQGPRLRTIETIDGNTQEDYAKIKEFDSLTAINPFEQITLETGPQPVTMRVMDLLTPIGKGQRALIVAPPRSGKTMLLQDIANSVSVNHPEIHLIVLLIDERPEEVTEMCRKVNGEVIASSMDRDVESHVRISQLIIERGKRLAEAGKDVFILLDSITRTARAFNKWISSGRTGTGGLDVKAMDIPRKMFGTARRFDEGGSLTVVATALIDTGSAMDQAIFQEFKGTGNMEMVLNRNLADRRIWPAIDIKQSGTRREEKILPPDVLEGVTLLRRSLATLDSVEAMEQLTKTLAKFPSNREFMARVKSIL